MAERLGRFFSFRAARYRSLDQFALYGKGWLNRTWAARLTLAMELAMAGAAAA